MPAHLENSAVATGLEKVRFHSNPKETHPGIEPISAVEVWNSNHWTAREVPSFPQFWSGCVLGHSSGSTGVIGNY